jgi:cytochrome c oxidase accessory protein FixG
MEADVFAASERPEFLPSEVDGSAADRGSLLAPPDRVLSTLNNDGTRRWLRPRPSPGRFQRARLIVAWALIAVFTLLPHIRIAGRPSLLLDLSKREFTFFGFTFLPTDTLLLALFVLGTILTIFLLTALLGRVWCGWACPQTVYLEFVYRPLERLFEGAPGVRPLVGRVPLGLRRALRFATYLLVSLFLAHTFLAYFVGVDDLAMWMRRSPIEHPSSFLVMLVTTGLMLFNFGYFREQTCIVACPYGRLQSVLFDRHTLIISYDQQRGEPRGKPSGKRAAVALPQASRGDCIDCGLCVVTCPTGIDIRDGLQLECVGCAQCIDACDKVMDKMTRPRGLIRYSSQAALSGQAPRLLRARIILYPAILLIVLALFSYLLITRAPADVRLLRTVGMPFVTLPDGRIANNLRLKITNRTQQPAAYRIELLDLPGASITLTEDPLQVASGQSRTEGLTIATPPDVFTDGERHVRLRVSDGAAFSRDVHAHLLGPATPPATATTGATP